MEHTIALREMARKKQLKSRLYNQSERLEIRATLRNRIELKNLDKKLAYIHKSEKRNIFEISRRLNKVASDTHELVPGFLGNDKDFLANNAPQNSDRSLNRAISDGLVLTLRGKSIANLVPVKPMSMLDFTLKRPSRGDIGAITLLPEKKASMPDAASNVHPEKLKPVPKSQAKLGDINLHMKDFQNELFKPALLSKLEEEQRSLANQRKSSLELIRKKQTKTNSELDLKVRDFCDKVTASLKAEAKEREETEAKLLKRQRSRPSDFGLIVEAN